MFTVLIIFHDCVCMLTYLYDVDSLLRQIESFTVDIHICRSHVCRRQSITEDCCCQLHKTFTHTIAVYCCKNTMEKLKQSKILNYLYNLYNTVKLCAEGQLASILCAAASCPEFISNEIHRACVSRDKKSASHCCLINRMINRSPLKGLYLWQMPQYHLQCYKQFQSHFLPGN